MLFEREPELSLLDDLLADLDVAGGKVVLVRGEAGIGKSALVLVRRAQKHPFSGARVMTC